MSLLSADYSAATLSHNVKIGIKTCSVILRHKGPHRSHTGQISRHKKNYTLVMLSVLISGIAQTLTTLKYHWAANFIDTHSTALLCNNGI